FVETYGARGMARGAVVVIVSDGWYTGDPAVLGAQMRRLSRLAYRIVWANPRTASPRYQPLAGGMAAAWPYCDAVVSAHHLAALDELIAAIGAVRGERTRPPVVAEGEVVRRAWGNGRAARLVADGPAGRDGHGGGHRGQRAAPAGSDHAGRPGRQRGRQRLRWLCRGRGLRAGPAGGRLRHAGAGSLRRERRRRVRGGSHLWRHHRDLRT